MKRIISKILSILCIISLLSTSLFTLQILNPQKAHAAGEIVETHSGIWAMKLDCTQTPIYSGPIQYFTGLQPNTNYTFKVWIKGTGKLSLAVKNQDTSGQFITQPFQATDTWTEVSVTFNTGSYTRANPQIQNNYKITDGYVYIDDAYFGLTGGDTNLLQNSGFESGNVKWNMYGSIPNVFSIVQIPQTSVISPQTAQFDKGIGYQKDISVAMSVYSGDSLAGIKNGSNDLNIDTDYIVSGNTVIIKKEYLATLQKGTSILTFDFNIMPDRDLTVNVIETMISTVNPQTAKFDKGEGYRNDISITMTLYPGDSLLGIKNGSTDLIKDIDYTVNGNIAVISRYYLSTLQTGTATLTFDFDTTPDQNLTVNVVETLPAPSTDPDTHSGAYALRAKLIGVKIYNGTYQEVQGIDANTNYVAKVWIKGTGRVRMVIKSGDWKTELKSVEANVTDQWTQISTEPFNTGSNTKLNLQFMLTDTRKGMLYIDDVYMGMDFGLNKVKNGNFEQGKAYWVECDPLYVARPSIDPLPTLPPRTLYKGGWSTYEAENAALAGSASIISDTKASNVKVVGNLNTAGSSVEFTKVTAGNTLSFSYSANLSQSSGTIGLYVNGVRTRDLTVDNTGSDSVYKEKTINLDIPLGTAVKIQYDQGDVPIRLDLIRTYFNYEAENAIISGSPAVYDDVYASNGKAVGSLSINDGKITFENTAGGDEIAIGYSAQNDGKLSLYINDSHAWDMYYQGSGKFTGDRAYYEQSAYINIPENARITLQSDEGDGTINIDYIKIVPKPVLDPGSTGIPDGEMITGVFVGNTTDGIVNFENWLGRTDISVLAYDGHQNWSDWDGAIGYMINTIWRNTDNKLLWSIPIIPYAMKEDGSDSNLEDSAKGVYNEHYKKAAQTIANFCSNYDVIYIRLGWEFNGDWFPWTAVAKTGEIQEKKAQDYIGAYRQMVKMFRSVSPKFRFEWCTNLGTTSLAPDLCYPGDDYVDLIGMDVYDETLWSKIYDPVERFEYTITRPYGLLWQCDFAKAQGKRIAYSEWGVGGNGSGDTPYIVDAMYKWFVANNVVLQTVWNSNSGYTGTLSNNQYPQLAAEYKALFGSTIPPQNGVNTPGNLITAVTSPIPYGKDGAAVTLNALPAEIKGIALDPDGNQNIDSVKVTIQNSAGKYLDMSMKRYVSEEVYNNAVYNASSGYWTIDVSNFVFMNDQYTVKAYASDGADNIPGACRFTIDSPDSNHAPTAQDYNAETYQNVPVTGLISGTDTDGDPLTYELAENPANGSVTLDSAGNWTYTPNKDFVGNDKFTCVITDVYGAAAVSSIYITVKEDYLLASELILKIDGMNIEHGVKNSLTSKLDNVLISMKDEDKKLSINHLTAFQNEVNAQNGKKLNADQVNDINTVVNKTIYALKV